MKKINIGIQTKEGKLGNGRTVVSPNLIKESVRLDRDGNIIDPKTKRIIKPKENESILR